MTITYPWQVQISLLQSLLLYVSKGIKMTGWVWLLTVATPLWADNVILFIGDGMGQAVITATRIFYKNPEGSLEIDKFPYTAISKTYSADSIVTESAAAASAMATGRKMRAGVLSLDPDNGQALETLAEKAKKMGMSVGIVTTTRITHATPAAFYAHIDSRDKEKEIGQQMLASGFDLFLGGGAKFFDKQALLQSGKFDLVFKRSELLQADDRSAKPLIGLFHDDHLTYIGEKGPAHQEEPTLVEMTEFAIRKLRRNKKGYFLMVEGGRIDHAQHATLARYALAEMAEFDRAIGHARSMVSEKETLILVTADHETGGLNINGYPARGADLLGNVLREGTTVPILTFATGPNSPYKMKSAAHTGVDVAVYAWGKGAEKVRGTVENTQIFHWVLEALKSK